MYNLLKTLIVSIILLIKLVNCGDFKCPSIGTKNGKKVPNLLKLVPKQNGYQSTVEVNTVDRENLVHEYFNGDRKIGYIDLEAMYQDEMNRRYYYHETGEKIAIRKDYCTRIDLGQKEKVNSIKDWFEPQDIVETSEIFKDFVHFGPSVLMIYANSLNDKASFVGTELIDGRSIDHWFYCIQDDGPYIDFYFDAITSHPYRFSLFYPKLAAGGGGLENGTTQTEEGRDTDYVYNFFIFKPLVISASEPIPFPVGYGCTLKGSSWKAVLPEFTVIPKFSLVMEAVITYPSGEIIKSTAQIMKVNDIYSYEITEEEGTVRSIENPPPLGRWQVDQATGSCKYFTSEYLSSITLVTRWPFFTDRGFNLLYYIVMKPTSTARPSFIGNIDLGPIRIEEYRANKFFMNSVDAIVDYYYPVSNNAIDSNNIPGKIVYTKDQSQTYYANGIPDRVEVTLIDFKTEYFDYEDRFDVSGCFQEPGMYTWFQLVFSNPWLTSTGYNSVIRENVHEFLIDFIPITRISDIAIDVIDSNLYVTVKLLDRIHFIEAYSPYQNTKMGNPNKMFKYFRVEDCEESCTSNPTCLEFSYCSDFSCSLFIDDANTLPFADYDSNCTHYSIEIHNEASEWVEKNYLSPMRFVLNQIRRKVDQNLLIIRSIGSTAEEMFIVHGPEEIGDLTESNEATPEGHLVYSDEYNVIQVDRKFDSNVKTQLKVEYTDCLRLCSNDDDCNSFSYCPDQNKQCILSIETSATLEKLIGQVTVKGEGCNIYEKSYINHFHKYSGKSLVVDSAATKESIQLTDCASECIKTKDFNCQSFDYCSDQKSKNGSVCFLHVHHLTADVNNVNLSNWKFAQNGCDHYSKKSDHDYQHIVAHQFSPMVKVIGTYEELPLEDCANQCNTNQVNCYTFEYCEVIDGSLAEDVDYHSPLSTWIKSSCRLSNIKPSTISNTKDPDFVKHFDKSDSNGKICSIYVNQQKIIKPTVNPGQDDDDLNLSSKSQIDRTNLAFGLGPFIFILAFGLGVVGFFIAYKRNLISL